MILSEKSTDSIITKYIIQIPIHYVRRRYWDVLDKANLVGKNLCEGKSYFKTGSIFYGLFLDPKKKYCLTIDEYGIIQ